MAQTGIGIAISAVFSTKPPGGVPPPPVSYKLLTEDLENYITEDGDYLRQE